MTDWPKIDEVGLTEGMTVAVPVATVIERVAVVDSELASVTSIPNEKVPDVLGVPVMTPVAELSDNPGGRLPAEIDQV